MRRLLFVCAAAGALVIALLLREGRSSSDEGGAGVAAAMPAQEVAPPADEGSASRLPLAEPAHLPGRSAVPVAPEFADGPSVRATEAAASSLEVRVVVSERPEPAADVELVTVDEGLEYLVGGIEVEPLRRASTDRTGVARFERLPSGRFGVRVRAGSILARTRVALDGSGAREVVVSLGRASVGGRAFDEGGRPAQGARVLAMQRSAQGDPRLWFVSPSGRDGSWRIEGLAGGSSWKFDVLPLDLAAGTVEDFELAADEHRVIDIGSPLGRARWSGRLTTLAGEVVGGPHRLAFVERSTGAVEQGFLSVDGSFDARLTAGAYTARLGGPAGIALGDAQVAGAIVQDLVAPGIALRGTIAYVGTKHPRVLGPETEVVVDLEREEGYGSAAVLLRSGSRFVLHGLTRGRYTLSTRPWVLTGGPVSIEVRDGRAPDEVALTITDP